MIAKLRAEAPYLVGILAFALVMAPVLWLFPVVVLGLIPAMAALLALASRPAWTLPFVFGALMLSDGIDFGITVGVVLSVGKLGMLFVLSAWALHCIVTRRWPFELNKLWVAHGAILAVLIIWLVPSRFVSANVIAAVVGFALLGIMMQVIVATAEPDDFRVSMLAVGGIYIGVAAAGLFLGRDIVSASYARNAGFGGNPNQWALSLLMGLGPAIAIFEGAKSSLIRWLAFAALGIGVIATLATVSRAALLVLAVLSPAFVVMLWRRRIALIVVGLGLAVAGPGVLDLDSVFERMDSFMDEGEAEMDGSIRDRSIVARFAIETFLDNPVVGIGTGAFAEEVEVASGGQVALVAHNTYLGILAEQGLIGGGVFLGFLSFLAWELFGAYQRQPSRTARRFTFGLAGSLLAYIGCALAIDALYFAPGFFWFAVMFIWCQLTRLPTERLVALGLA